MNTIDTVTDIATTANSVEDLLDALTAAAFDAEVIRLIDGGAAGAIVEVLDEKASLYRIAFGLPQRRLSADSGWADYGRRAVWTPKSVRVVLVAP